MSTASIHQKVLGDELSKRCGRNGTYSLRAFAKALAVDPAVLSRAINGSRKLSPKVAQRVAEKLDLSPQQRQAFIAAATTRSKLGVQGKVAATPETLSIDTFSVISEWYHYAVLELTFSNEFRLEPRWIAKAIGITVIRAKLAIERLVRLGLLVEEQGRWVKAKVHLTTGSKDVSTPALRNHQRQILEKAVFSLENDPIEYRSMTGMMMAIDPQKLHEAKKYIEEFMQNMCKLLETGPSRQVYQLGVSLYPIQQRSNVV